MGPRHAAKAVADVNEWAQHIFGKFCKLHRMGPVLFREVISIILMGPDMPPKPTADVIKWAQGFLGSSANYIGWAQCFPKKFCQ